MKKVIFLIFLSYSLNGQESIVSSGATANENNCSVSYSVGQIFYQSYESQSDILLINEGVQQPYEIFGESSDEEDTTEIKDEIIEPVPEEIKITKYSLSVYPNPSVTSVTLDIDSFDTTDQYRYQIRSMHGKLIKVSDIGSASTKIDISMLYDGLFYLTITHESDIVTTFKLLKLNN